MAGKTTRALTQEQYTEIITTMKQGFSGCRPNTRIAEALMLEANLGLRISDILNLSLSSIVKDGGRYRLNIVEQKTGKRRTFTVPTMLYDHVKVYCADNGIGFDEKIFPITERAVQKQLKIVCDYLGEGYENISTHSFRKFFATSIYLDSGYNIELVKTLLQHSSTTTTSRYIGIGTEELESALENHILIV